MTCHLATYPRWEATGGGLVRREAKIGADDVTCYVYVLTVSIPGLHVSMFNVDGLSNPMTACCTFAHHGTRHTPLPHRPPTTPTTPRVHTALVISPHALPTTCHFTHALPTLHCYTLHGSRTPRTVLVYERLYSMMPAPLHTHYLFA